jgi:eukaryotic translation initiation factor 2C
VGSGNTITLQKKLKLVRVKIVHLPIKKSKNGVEIPRVKTIFGLAHAQDGRSSAHPPQVLGHGAGPKNVKFWLDGVPPAAADSGQKSSGKTPAGPAFPSNTYISVFDYFRRSMYYPLPYARVY